ncbi:MAG: tetratricopeptide repeat protein [Gemmatimonadota bacterium]
MPISARIDELRKKFDENPRRYFAPLANELRKQGDLTQAIALCRTHLPNQPGHLSGHIVLAQTLYESSELVESRQIFEAALDLDPENLIALRYLGDIAREQGAISAARSWYERVLEADPRNEEIAGLLNGLTGLTDAPPSEESRAVEPTAFGQAELTTGYANAEFAEPAAFAPDNHHDAPGTTSTWDAVDADIDVPEAAIPQEEEPSADYSVPTAGLVTFEAPSTAPAHTSLEPSLSRSSQEPELAERAEEFTSEDFDLAPTPTAHHAPYSAPPGDPEAAPDLNLDDWFAQPPVAAAAHQTVDPPESPTDLFPPLDHSRLPSATTQIPVEQLFEESIVSDNFAESTPPAPDTRPEYRTEAVSDVEAPEMGAYASDAGGTVVPPGEEVAPTVGSFPDFESDDQSRDVTHPGFDTFSEFDVSAPQGTADQDDLTASGAVVDDAATVESENTRGMGWEAALSPGQLDDSIGRSGGWDAIPAPDADESAVMSPRSSFATGDEPAADVLEPEPVAAENQGWYDDEADDEPSLADPLLGRTPDLDNPGETGPAPFVTETMAELYLQQGFVDEALSIYRQLLARHPDDQTLRDRIASLEEPATEAAAPTNEAEPAEGFAGQSTAEASTWSAEAEWPEGATAASDPADAVWSAGPAAASESAGDPWSPGSQAAPEARPVEPARIAEGEPTAREFFGRFARRTATRGGGSRGNAVNGVRKSPDPDAVDGPWPRIGGAANSSEALTQPDAHATSLAELFAAGTVAPADEQAAVDLASAFTASTREIAAATPPGDLSLHNLFGDVPAHSGGAVTSPASTYSSPTIHGSEPGYSGADRAARSDSDIEQFTAWLEGLKKK